jgi:hypothetical protein
MKDLKILICGERQAGADRSSDHKKENRVMKFELRSLNYAMTGCGLQFEEF